MPGSFIALSPRPLLRFFPTTPAAGPVRLMFCFPVCWTPAMQPRAVKPAAATMTARSAASLARVVFDNSLARGGGRRHGRAGSDLRRAGLDPWPRRLDPRSFPPSPAEYLPVAAG
jgi:hypothetical protein